MTSADEKLGSTPELSDEEWEQETPELSGTLNKWTNYIHGWQKRYMAIKVNNATSTTALSSIVTMANVATQLILTNLLYTTFWMSDNLPLK